MKKKIIAVLSALIISVSFAIPVFAVDTPVTWDDLSEDAQAIGNVYAEAFSQYLKGDVIGGSLSFRDVPISYYKFVADLGWCISPVDDVYYYLVDGELFIDDTGYHHSGGGGFHNPSHSSHSGAAGRRRVSPDEDLGATAEFYNSITTKYPAPFTTYDYVSYKNDYYLSEVDRSFYFEGNFGIRGSGFREAYIVPFAIKDGITYHSDCIIHFRQLIGEKDPDTGLKPLTLQYQLGTFGSDSYSDWVSIVDLSTYRYLRSAFSSQYMTVACYDNAYKLNNNQRTSTVRIENVGNPFAAVGTLYNFTNHSQFISFPSFNNNELSITDCGYYISDSPFLYEFPTLDDNTLIYPSTTNIYNWYIDDPNDDKAGDTITNYIINNYVYPDNPTSPDDSGDDNSGGGSGTTSGDVTVSGRVEVDGSITIDTKPIDININVNSDSGSGTSSDLPPVDDFVEFLPEQSQTMTDYLSIFFSFLPVELLALLLSGVAVAILCRVLGR